MLTAARRDLSLRKNVTAYIHVYTIYIQRRIYTYTEYILNEAIMKVTVSHKPRLLDLIYLLQGLVS